uniref:Uncharacterized protein n=1 Tax=Manihot esculenta TaxID=3983 RepID=A0A2C9UZT2_MANES
MKNKEHNRSVNDEMGQNKTFSRGYLCLLKMCIWRLQVDANDPNAEKTLSRVEAIQKTCRESGLLNKRRSYIIRSEPRYSSALIVLLVIILSIISALHLGNRPTN